MRKGGFARVGVSCKYADWRRESFNTGKKYFLALRKIKAAASEKGGGAPRRPVRDGDREIQWRIMGKKRVRQKKRENRFLGSNIRRG